MAHVCPWLGRPGHGMEEPGTWTALQGHQATGVPCKVERRVTPVAGEVALTPESLPVPGGAAFETILGINNLQQISWIGRGLEASRSVCRVLSPNGIGTGFLVSPGVMMTNNHVIPSHAVAEQTVVEFNYQEDAAGKPLEIARVCSTTRRPSIP